MVSPDKYTTLEAHVPQTQEACQHPLRAPGICTQGPSPNIHSRTWGVPGVW